MRYPWEFVATLLLPLLGLGLAVIPFIVLYQITKAAVRNGINESVLGRAQTRHEPRM